MLEPMTKAGRKGISIWPFIFIQSSEKTHRRGKREERRRKLAAQINQREKLSMVREEFKES